MSKAATHMPSSVDAGWIDTILRILDEFRKVNPDVTANQIVTFLAIAKNPGTSQVDVLKTVGLSDGGIARICAVLSDRGNRGQPGQGLIEIRSGAEDYRSVALYPSTKGRRVLASLKHIMKR